MINWKEIDSNFTPELQKEWEEGGFDYVSARDWIHVGLPVTEIDYARWLKYVKQKDPKWLLNNDRKQLEQEYFDSFLIREIVKAIKSVERCSNNNQLLLESLIPTLIPNKQLIERYKKYQLCKKCGQPNNDKNICQLCDCQRQNEQMNIVNNYVINNFIQKHNLESIKDGQVLEWVPYQRFTDIKYLDEGGFSKIYTAKWIDPLIEKWDKKDKNFRLVKDYGKYKTIVLKNLNNSQNITSNFLQEVSYHKLFDIQGVVPCYGISQDPITSNYVMVTEYIKDGSLRKYLQNNYKKDCLETKLNQLFTVISGLSSIHEKGLVHRDFHSGNILLSKLENKLSFCWITDLGLSRPANEL